MNTNAAINKFYENLGFQTQRNLNKVRGQKLSKLTADEFMALPEFKRTMVQRKATLKDQEAFKTGFERARLHQ